MANQRHILRAKFDTLTASSTTDIFVVTPNIHGIVYTDAGVRGRIVTLGYVPSGCGGGINTTRSVQVFDLYISGGNMSTCNLTSLGGTTGLTVVSTTSSATFQFYASYATRYFMSYMELDVTS